MTVIEMVETFHSTAEVMARYFPNYVKEKMQKERGAIYIIPRPSARR